MARRVRLVVSLALAGALVGWMAGQLAATGQAVAVVGIAILLVPVALWRRPQIAPLVLIAAALLIEQVGQGVASTGVDEPGAGDVVLTAHIPITSSIPLFRGIGSLHMQPVDLLLAGAFVLYLVKSLDWGPRWRPRSHVSLAIGGLLCVVIARDRGRRRRTRRHAGRVHGGAAVRLPGVGLLPHRGAHPQQGRPARSALDARRRHRPEGPPRALHLRADPPPEPSPRGRARP